MNLIQNLFSTDFCPWANRYVYWLKQPLGWFALAAVASLLIGMYVSINGWTMLACCLVIIAIQLVWPWVQIKLCHCEVIFDSQRTEEWSENLVRVRLVNRGPIPLWGLAIEQGFFLPDTHENSDDKQISVTLSRVPPFSANEYRWQFVPQRRGVYPLKQPCISTAFPFGIWTAHKDVSVKDELIVWPRTTTLFGLPDVDATGTAPLGAMRDRAGDQGDVLGSRLWQPGESLRMVNWAQTARSDEDLFVLERQSCARTCVQVIIDPAPHDNPQRQQTVFDWQVRINATLTQFFHGHQFDLRSGFVGASKTIASSRVGIHAWMDELAQLEPSSCNLPSASSNGHRNRFTFLITGLAGWRSKAGSHPNLFPIFVLTRDDSRSELPDQCIIIDLDDEDRDPFTQFANSWRAANCVK